MEMKQEGILDGFEDADDLNLKNKCSTYAEDIKKGHLNISQLIELLKDLLTNQSPSKRELGINILNGVLKCLPLDSLTSSQLQLIAEYYSEKFKDHHQVLPCTLKGILTIIEFDNFPGASVPGLLNSLFRNVACQQQQKDDRHTIYCIFQVLSRRFSCELLSMKLECVYGVMTAIDGERDPRNLLFLFKWLKTFLGMVTLEHLSEDMFDTLACYFPVDFKAPPSEKSITREALAEALSTCLCAIPVFGEYCIPLALEKLESSLEIAKLDSLQLLKQGCQVFEVGVYLDKAAEIFSQLQSEIFSRDNSTEMKTECLDILTHIVDKISQSDEDDQFKYILKNIVDSVKGNLLPESKFFEASSQILTHAASGSKTSSTFVVEEVVPLLMNIYLIANKPAQKCLVLKVLVNLTNCYLRHHSTNWVNNTELSKVPSMCLELLNCDNESKQVGFETLTDLAPCLSEELRLKLYAALRTSILSDEKPDLRKSMLQCLNVFEGLYGDEVEENVFSLFSESRPNVIVVDKMLNAQCALMKSNGYRDYIINNLLDCVIISDFAEVTLKNLVCLLEEHTNVLDISLALAQRGLVDILIELAFSEKVDRTLLIDISKVLKLLIRPQNGYTQMKIIGRHLEFVYRRTQASEVYVTILDGIVSNLRRDVQVEFKILLLALEISITSTRFGEIAMQVIANLVNKCELLTPELLSEIKERCWNSIKISQRNSIMTICWITRALLMRNHNDGIQWLETLLDMIEQYSEVKEGLKIIMDDSFESMSTDCYCNKVSLYRQKAFVLITNKMCETGKMAHIEALGYIIQFAPTQAILLQFKKIVRFIILCLDKFGDPEVLCIFLKHIRIVLSEQSDLIEDHLEDFLSRILKLTLFQPNMSVRIEALQCLSQFASRFPVYKLLPLKKEVLQCLRQCVDDRKRLVRKEAMEVRHLWFILDAPI